MNEIILMNASICSICDCICDRNLLYKDITCGKERGLICKNCLNLLLSVNNDKDILLKAIKYLAKWEMEDGCSKTFQCEQE